MNHHLTRGLFLACREAGSLLLRLRSGGVHATEKGGMELVTVADTESENLLESMLHDLSPDVPFMGEEGYAGSLPPPPYWIADPLDGTNNYAFDYPFYCVSAAYVDSDGPAFCCTFDPARNESFTAEREKGAWLNGKPIRCSAALELSDALMATGFPYNRTPENINTDLEVLAHFLGVARGIRRSGSAALDLAYTACGRLGGFWEKSLRPWDMAAGALLVREAGGVVGAYEGGDWSMVSEGVCAGGKALWPLIRQGVDKARGAAGRGAP